MARRRRSRWVIHDAEESFGTDIRRGKKRREEETRDDQLRYTEKNRKVFSEPRRSSHVLSV
jgi:hypothetical protein